MIEARVHAELKRLGGWRSISHLRAFLPFEGTSISDALSRLRKRGAVEQAGKNKGTVWKALDVPVGDRRQFNGGFQRKNDKPRPVAVPKPHKPDSHVLPSALEQALAWQP